MASYIRLFFGRSCQNSREKNSRFYENSRQIFPKNSRYRRFSFRFSAKHKVPEVYEALRGLESKNISCTALISTEKVFFLKIEGYRKENSRVYW